MRRLVVMACLVLSAGPVFAADWQQIGGTRGGFTAVDDESLQWRDDFVSFWARLSAPGDTAAINNYLVQLSCTTHQIRVAVTPGMAIGGSPFGPSNGSPYTFQPATGGVAAALQGHVCARMPRPRVTPVTAGAPARMQGPRGRIPGPDLPH